MFSFCLKSTIIFLIETKNTIVILNFVIIFILSDLRKIFTLVLKWYVRSFVIDYRESDFGN